jgi:molecular chaperone GrpE
MKDKDKTKETPVKKPAEINEEEIKTSPSVEERLEEFQKELENVKDKYLRSLAEMENFKKRNTEEIKRERKYASQPIVDKLIDQLEVFEQALNVKTDDSNFKNFLYGFRMIKDMLFNVLLEEGVSKIDIITGNSFDPNTMHAIEIQFDAEQPENSVLKVVKNGYMYKDRLLRPATVVINQKPENQIDNEKLDANVA